MAVGERRAYGEAQNAQGARGNRETEEEQMPHDKAETRKDFAGKWAWLCDAGEIEHLLANGGEVAWPLAYPPDAPLDPAERW